MTRFEPTLAWLKLPTCESVTTSPPTTPTNDPPETVAIVAPSYTLLATVVPETVKALGVMLAVNPVGCVSV